MRSPLLHDGGVDGSVDEATSAQLVLELAGAGCVAPEAEAEELVAAAGEGRGSIEELVVRRIRGEPLPWIVGSASFCGLRILIEPGVFVPRPHTEDLARRAADLLPAGGIAVDLCTGSGAVAAVLLAAHPDATVIGTDVDPIAVACARRNGVDALEGDLDAPLPAALSGRVDVLTAVVPYVPAEELHLLPRDVRAFEPPRALDGGPGGTATLLRAAAAAGRILRPGGSALLELGGDQAGPVTEALSDAGMEQIRIHRDDEGADRAIEARRAGGD